MKVLQICNKPPYPPVDGGCLAMHNLTLGLLQNGVDVTVLAIHTPKHFCDTKKLPENYLLSTKIKTTYIDTGIKPLHALINIFRKQPYNVERFYSKEFESLIIDALKKNKFDIIQLESIYVTPYYNCIRNNTNAKVIIRSHNIEHILWERRSKEEKNILKKTYLTLLSNKLKKYELDIAAQVDGIACITQNDLNYIENAGINKPLANIPFGVEAEKYNTGTLINSNTDVFFIGALDWQPNLQGLLWFINNVWNVTIKKWPQLKLYIAGKRTPFQIKKLESANIIVMGEVPDAVEFMSKHHLMIVPLFSGGGMRVKIIEGMAMGKTIITTGIGAEGIKCINGETILIANTAEDFIKQLDKCLSDTEHCKQIGEKAKSFINNNYNNSIIANKLVLFYKNIIQ